jgi:tetratricopeptide (TPR) repeat protein
MLADRAGISRYWLGQVELGKGSVSARSVAALYRVLVEHLPGLSLPWLLLGEGRPPEGASPLGPQPAARRDLARPSPEGALPKTLPALSETLTVDVERSSSSASLDEEVIADFERLTRALGHLRRTLPPAELLPMIEAHLACVRRRMADGAGPSGPWRSLQSIAAGTATLCGWVYFTLERRKEASAYLAWAERLAREIDDRNVLMLDLMLRSDLASAVPTGGHEGLPQEARRLLDEALSLRASSTPGCLAGPLLLRSAEEHAFAGAESNSQRDLERADGVLAAAERRGFYLRPDTDAADWSLAIARSFRGSCLQLQGRAAQAIEALESVTATLHLPLDLVAPLTDLAAAHAQVGDLDRACELLSHALGIVSDRGQPERARRIAGVRRRHLARWAGEPTVRRLDEQLALVL